MADTTIRGLSAGTLAIDTAFVGQNTGTGTLAEKFDYSVMGGMILASSSANTNLTATVGTLLQWTIAGITAVRSFILPDTAAAGEIVGVYIVDGDATEEIAIKTAATGSLLNGVDHSSTAYTNLFIKGEHMAFRCVNGGGAGDTDWIVVEDGRIPCVARMYLGSDDLNFMVTNNTAYQVLVDTSDIDNFSGVDTGNSHIALRRDGKVRAKGTWTNSDNFSASGIVRAIISKNNNATNIGTAFMHWNTTTWNGSEITCTGDYSDGDTIELWAQDAAIANQGAFGGAGITWLEIEEILNA